MPFTLTVSNGATFDRNHVVLTGAAPVGSQVEVTVRSEEQVGIVTTNSQGQWSWTPPQLLEPGQHSYQARLVLGANSFSDSLPAIYFMVTDSLFGMPGTGAALGFMSFAGIGITTIGFGHRSYSKRITTSSRQKYKNDIPVPPILIE